MDTFFQNAEAEAIFSWSGEHVAGNVHVLGESWVLEGCGDQCFLWIKQTNDWLDETSAPDSKIRSGIVQPPKNMTQLLVRISGSTLHYYYPSLQARGLEDTTTEVSYTVMIWYTPEFLASFASEADMNVFIDLVFEETNQGYINSEMPVSMTRINMIFII